MKLIVEEHGKSVTYDLDEVEVTIGRGLENTVPIKDPLASRRHVRLEAQGSGAVAARDTGSRNGTLLNERPLRQAALAPGDCLRIGETRIWFERRPDGADGPRAAADGCATDPRDAGLEAVHERVTEESRPAARIDPIGAAPAAPAAPAAMTPIPVDDDDDDDDLAATPRQALGADARYLLEVVAGPGKGERIGVPGFPFRMGRRKLNHLVLRDPEASSSHCELVAREPDGVVLVDLDSTNGTSVNNARVKRAVLADGAQIRIGETVIVFRDRGARARGEGAPDPSGVLRAGGKPARPRAAPGKPIVAPQAAAGGAGGAAGSIDPLEDPSELARAAARLGEGAVEQAFAGSSVRGALAAGFVGLAVLVAFGAFAWTAMQSGEPADPDPSPAKNLVRRNWSFEEGPAGSSLPGWQPLELAAGHGAGLAEAIVVDGGAPGGLRALRLAPGDGAVAALASVEAIAVSAPIEVRARVRADGAFGRDASAALDELLGAGAAPHAIAGIAVRWESSRAPGRARLEAHGLSAGRGFGEVRASFTPPEGFDRARVVLLAAGPALFDRVVCSERDDLRPRARFVDAGGLAASIDERGVLRFERDERTSFDAIEVVALGAGPAQALASQATPVAARGPDPIQPPRAAAPGKADADAEPLGWQVEGAFLGPLGGHAIGYRVELRAQQGEVQAVWSARRAGAAASTGEPAGTSTGAPAPSLALRLWLRDPDLVREIAIQTSTTAEPARPPMRAEAVEEVAFGIGQDQVSLRFSPPVALRIAAEGAGAIVEVDLPRSTGPLELAFVRGSTSERRAVERRLAEALALEGQGRLEAARLVYVRLARDAADPDVKARAQRAQQAIADRGDAALGEAASIEADVEDTGVVSLIDAAEARCRFVAEAFAGTPRADRAHDLLRRMADRRARLEGAARIVQAQALYEAGRRHLEKSRYRLARVYFAWIEAAYPDLRVAQDARRDRDHCEQKLQGEGS